jgi:hypothetical protein
VSWVMLFVGLAFAGLVVIGACSVRLFAAVRDLGRELQQARRRLEPKRSALLAAAERLERASE